MCYYHAERKSYIFFQFSTFVDFKNLLPSEQVLGELTILCDILQYMIYFIVISYHSTTHIQLYEYLTSSRGFNYSLIVETITLLKYPTVSKTLTMSLLKWIFSTRYHSHWLPESCIITS